MAKSVEKKCNYSHCKHDTKIIDISKDDYQIEENGKYIHTDCKREKDTMLEIIDFWYRNIDADVIFTQLRRLLDRLVYSEHVDPDYILYAIKKKAKYLNYPPGIIYAIKDKEVKKSYEHEQKIRAFKETLGNQVAPQQSDEPVFTYNDNSNKKKFGDIFGGN